MSTCNCKFGTLLELACTGKADQHFIGAPSHSLFHQQYHQHGNFAVDWCVKDPFRGTGQTLKATISKEGDLLIGGMIVLTSSKGQNVIPSIPNNAGTCRLLIGNQCIQTRQIQKITAIHRAYHSQPLPAKTKKQVMTSFNLDFQNPKTTTSTIGLYDINNIYGAEFFFIKEKTPMWLHTNQTIEIELEVDYDSITNPTSRKVLNKDVSVHFQSFQVYLPENERTPPSMQHLPIRVQQTMEYNLAEIQPDSRLRLKLPFNLPIYRLRHGLSSTSQTEIVRVYVNNNLRFEGTPSEIQAIASLFYESPNVILFGIPSEDGFGGAFNMSRADTVEVEFEFDTVNATDEEKEDRKRLAFLAYPTKKNIIAYSYNILQYQNGRYSLLYSD